MSLNGAAGKEHPVKEETMPGGFYGFFRCESNIFTDSLRYVDKAVIMELQRTRGVGMTGRSAEELLKYHAIADFESWKLYRIDTTNTINGKTHVDDISVFWGNAKSRLLKFRGLNKNTLYLHVKECEFRYNYRSADINTLLLNIIYKLPLHYSKVNS